MAGLEQHRCASSNSVRFSESDAILAGTGWPKRITGTGGFPLRRGGCSCAIMSHKAAGNGGYGKRFRSCLGENMLYCRSMAIQKKNAFSRRVPDLVTEELVTVLTQKITFEFKQLFDQVHENLRARNAASGGEEMLRLRAYEKLQNLVARGLVKKTGKKYKGLAALATVTQQQQQQQQAHVAAVAAAT